jgi:hypothetical protein
MTRFESGMIAAMLDHELSNPLAGREREYAPSKVSTIVILPPQHGHRGGSSATLG